MVQLTEIFDVLKEAVVAGDIDGMDASTQFEDVGIDSLDMANIFLLIEERYSVEIPDEKVGELQSVEAIIKYLNSERL